MYVHALYETIPREYLSLLLLGKELYRRDIPCEIEQLKSSSAPLKHKYPGVKILPFCYNDSNMKTSISKTLWNGEGAINMCWEQFCADWKRKAFFPKGKMIENNMQCVAWGEKYADRLRDANVPQQQIQKIGNIKFDLAFHKDLLFDRDFLAKRYNLDVTKPWMLIAWGINVSNQAGYNPNLQYSKKYNIPYPEKFFQTKVDTREAHIKLLKYLPDLFPNYEIIFRTHPSGVDGKELKALFADKFSNTYFICAFDIINWIVQSDVVFSWCSTSMIEAIAAGIPALSYEPVPYFERFGYDVGKIVPRAFTEEQTIEKLKNLPQLKAEANWHELEKWYGKIDGKSHIRLANLCEEMLNNIDNYSIPQDLIPQKIKTKIRCRWRRLVQKFCSNVSHSKKRLVAKRSVPIKKTNNVISGKSDIKSLLPWISNLSNT